MLGEMSGEPPPETVPTGIPALEASARSPVDEIPEVLIITGMSGAGRSRAAAILEDLAWYVVDNLPPQMLTHLVGMMTHGTSGVRRLAVVVDVRGRQFFTDFVQVLDALHAGGIRHRILYLDASDEVLVRRFEQVRRPHPLQGDGRIMDGITAERALLSEMRERADVVVDTSELNVHELAHEVVASFSPAGDAPLQVTVLSFGFKYGLPLDADNVADMRFLANPYWITELRHLTGRDPAVRDYVLGLPRAREFVDRYVEALEPVLAGYAEEDKRYVTIAIGCTGGKHRSVAVGEEVGAALRARGHQVEVRHRDLGRE